MPRRLCSSSFPSSRNRWAFRRQGLVLSGVPRLFCPVRPLSLFMRERGSALAPESGAQVLANENAAHAFMGRPEERPRHLSRIAAGLDERVGPRRDPVAPPAIPQGRSGLLRSRGPCWRAIARARKSSASRTRSAYRRSAWPPRRQFRMRRESQQPARPAHAAQEGCVFSEVGIRRRANRQGCASPFCSAAPKAISPPSISNCPATCIEGIGPRAQLFRDPIRRRSRRETAVHRVKRLAIEGMQNAFG